MENLVIYKALYGSQNYSLSDENSDKDYKEIVTPTLKDLINKKTISIKKEIDTGEVDVKDVKEMFSNILKANVNYLEIIFTNDFEIHEEFLEEILELRENRELIVRNNSYKLYDGILGMMLTKEKQLTNPRPSTKYNIDKYGYDGKNAYHILRLKSLFEEYFIKNNTFEESLDARNYSNYDTIIKIKKHKIEKEKALLLCKEAIDFVKSQEEIKKEFPNNKESVKEILDKIAEKIIIKSIRKEIH